MHDEREKEDVELVQGEIPKDLRGMFIRNGPNPQFTPEFYHWVCFIIDFGKIKMLTVVD